MFHEFYSWFFLHFSLSVSTFPLFGFNIASHKEPTSIRVQLQRRHVSVEVAFQSWAKNTHLLLWQLEFSVPRVRLQTCTERNVLQDGSSSFQSRGRRPGCRIKFSASECEYCARLLTHERRAAPPAGPRGCISTLGGTAVAVSPDSAVCWKRCSQIDAVKRTLGPELRVSNGGWGLFQTNPWAVAPESDQAEAPFFFSFYRFLTVVKRKIGVGTSRLSVRIKSNNVTLVKWKQIKGTIPLSYNGIYSAMNDIFFVTFVILNINIIIF